MADDEHYSGSSMISERVAAGDAPLPVRDRPRRGGHEQDPRLRVLRLASVFEPEGSVSDGDTSRFDPIGGMQNHTASLSRCLDRLGMEQLIITSRLAAPTGRRRLGVDASVRRVGVRTERFRQLWALCALPGVLATSRRRVDVVHVHQGEDIAVLLLGMLAGVLHRCPVVVTIHCSVCHTFLGSGLRSRLLRVFGGMVERHALQRATAVLVLVPRTARALAESGVPEDRIHVVPSGFDTELFAEPGRDPFPGVPHPRIGYVGRLAEQKAPHLLVEAFARVRPEASLVMVGDGPLRHVVDAAIQRSPARDRITTSGFVPHHRVPSVLSALDVLVLPSVYEEMGSVLVEAMASGLPVVATRVGGIPEVVVDGQTGLLVPPADVAALAEAIDQLVGDPDRRRRMGEAARTRSEQYSWTILADRVAALYLDVARR
jgi:glycogen(starch) synthase